MARIISVSPHPQTAKRYQIVARHQNWLCVRDTKKGIEFDIQCDSRNELHQMQVWTDTEWSAFLNV